MQVWTLQSVHCIKTAQSPPPPPLLDSFWSLSHQLYLRTPLTTIYRYSWHYFSFKNRPNSWLQFNITPGQPDLGCLTPDFRNFNLGSLLLAILARFSQNLTIQKEKSSTIAQAASPRQIISSRPLSFSIHLDPPPGQKKSIKKIATFRQTAAAMEGSDDQEGDYNIDIHEAAATLFTNGGRSRRTVAEGGPRAGLERRGVVRAYAAASDGDPGGSVRRVGQ